MRSTTKLNSGILSLLKLIGEKYPELLRNMDETPVASTVPAGGRKKRLELQQYYYTLRAIYTGYDQDHPEKRGGGTAGCE